MNTKRLFHWISVLIISPLLFAGCSGTPAQSIATIAPTPVRQTLGLGPLPDNAAMVIDLAIQNQYYTPNSFTAKALRMMARMKGVASGYVEIQSTDPGLPFPALEGGNPTLKPISPSHLQVRGLADGTDISILNYEEFIIQVEDDTDLGGAIAPKGTRLVRESNSWVLMGPS